MQSRCDLHDPARALQDRKVFVDHREDNEQVDLKLVPDGVGRQDLDRSGSRDTGVVDRNVEAPVTQRFGYRCSLGLHFCLLGHIADRQLTPLWLVSRESSLRHRSSRLRRPGPGQRTDQTNPEVIT